MFMSTSKKVKKPWSINWQIERDLGGGGQGATFVVKRRDGSDDNEYVLKILRRQDDSERRQRMYREVNALRRLQHTAVPKFIESNTDQHEDLNVPLYFVAEYVKGQTLEERINESTLKPAEALRLTIQLCDILVECHKNGVLHRDIKPENVVLRGVNAVDPILIDFGQSFNKEDIDDPRLTPVGQQLGNRFLHLPELQSADSAKRNIESDISQVCGLLFYTMTGRTPGPLRDQEDLKPHQRTSAKQIVDDIGSASLIGLFDKGFEHVFSKRFRSFDAFKGRVHEVLDEFSPPNAFDEHVGTVVFEKTATETRATIVSAGDGDNTRTKSTAAQRAETTYPQSVTGEEADALMLASLLGAWNEKVEGDRQAVEELVEGHD
jgi:eukaryotic-like serine/threonine-protein kinase